MKHEIPCHERSKHRIAMRNEMLAFLRRKPSDCGMDVESYVAEATARMKRPRPEKSEFTPAHDATWQTAMHLTTVGRKLIHEKAHTKKRNHVACQGVKTKRSWGKAGHKLANLISRAKEAKLKFENDKLYAGY